MRYFFLILLMWVPAFGEVRVVSYNIRQDTPSDRGTRDWSQRASGVAQFLKKGGFSVIGLQEARHNQIVDIRKKLPTFQLVGVGRDDGKKAGEYSPILFDPAIWTADKEEQGTFWLSDTPEKVGSKTWGNGVTRICSWVRLEGVDGKAVYVFNTHWDHQSQASREKAAVLILGKIKARNHKEESVILMGDFNATTENPAIKTLLSSGILVDHGLAKQHKTSNRWKPGLNEGLRIDHIFTSPAIKKARLKVLPPSDPVGSDHNPVALVIGG